MTFKFGRVAAWVASSLIASAPLVAMAATPAANTWPHTDVPADPSIVFGELPNGMRFLIKHNASPVGGISLRLRVGTGSLDETEANEGVAHFMEHMSFRGSAHFADGDAFKTLESLGASPGADSNAYTSYGSTVFMFDVAKSDPTALDTGLTLLRDIASEDNIDPKAVDTERKVVLAEARQDDVAAYHAYRASMAAALGPRIADALMPIGKQDVVENATAKQLREFYEQHYRPEHTTLVVIGDVDPKTAEEKILARFSDWHAARTAPKPLGLAVQTNAKPHFTVFSEAGAATGVSLIWAAPASEPPDTIEQEYHDLARETAISILNQRLQKLANSATPPFVAAQAEFHKIHGVADLTELEATSAPGKIPAALQALREAYGAILRDGVRDDELQQSLGNWRVFFENEAAAVDTTQSRRLAHDYLDVIDENGVIASPQENLALFRDAARRLTTADVDAEMRKLFAGAGPSVFASSPAPLAGGTSALEAAFNATPAQAATVASADAPSWPYTQFGPAGRVVSQSHDDALDLTRVTFANGVRAMIKPTKFHAGQVMVAVSFGTGRFGLSKDRATATWGLSAFVGGGLGKLDLDAIRKVFAGKSWGASFGVDDESFVLSGTTRPEDFESQMQLMGAYLTDPGWRPQAFARSQTAMLSALEQAGAAPGGVYSMHASAVAHNDDLRWHTPSPDDVRATRFDDVKAIIGTALAKGPVEVTVVGDISADAAVKGIATTLGAIKAHYATRETVAGDEHLPPPNAVPLSFRHRGGPDQAVAFIGWPTQGIASGAHEMRAVKVLELVMSQRLFDLLRTQEGMTYTPSTMVASSLATPTYGYLGVATEIPPAKVPAFYAAIERSVVALKDKEISADELARARDPHVEDVLHEQQTNEYWLNALRHAEADPRWLELVLSTVPDLKTVTTADLLHAARAYLTSDKAWKIVVLPEGFPAPEATKALAP